MLDAIEQVTGYHILNSGYVLNFYDNYHKNFYNEKKTRNYYEALINTIEAFKSNNIDRHITGFEETASVINEGLIINLVLHSVYKAKISIQIQPKEFYCFKNFFSWTLIINRKNELSCLRTKVFDVNHLCRDIDIFVLNEFKL